MGDTRLVLHALNCNANTVVVYTRDTDVLVMLVSYFPQFVGEAIWMLSGTAKKINTFPLKLFTKNCLQVLHYFSQHFMH